MRCVYSRQVPLVGVGACRPDHAQVHQLHCGTAPAAPNVVRLEVTMDVPLAVEGVHPSRQLETNVQHFAPPQHCAGLRQPAQQAMLMSGK